MDNNSKKHKRDKEHKRPEYEAYINFEKGIVRNKYKAKKGIKLNPKQ